jgi:hypothetical protein
MRNLLIAGTILGGLVGLAYINRSDYPPPAAATPTQAVQPTTTRAADSTNDATPELHGNWVCQQFPDESGSVWSPLIHCLPSARDLPIDQFLRSNGKVGAVTFWQLNLDAPQIGSTTWSVIKNNGMVDNSKTSDPVQGYIVTLSDGGGVAHSLAFDGITDFPTHFFISRDGLQQQIEADQATKEAKQRDLANANAAEQAKDQADWYYMDDDRNGEECHKLSGTPQQFSNRATKQGAADMAFRGNDILGSDVVISYKLHGKDYSYSFFRNHEKCENKFGSDDSTRSDFSRDPKMNGAMDTPEQTQSDSDALKHASDKNPWWMFDGSIVDPTCLRSKVSPMQDAQAAKAQGARNVTIHGGTPASNVPHPRDGVVEYDLNGKSFFNDYSKNKECEFNR